MTYDLQMMHVCYHQRNYLKWFALEREVILWIISWLSASLVIESTLAYQRCYPIFGKSLKFASYMYLLFRHRNFGLLHCFLFMSGFVIFSYPHAGWKCDCCSQLQWCGSWIIAHKVGFLIFSIIFFCSFLPQLSIDW